MRQTFYIMGLALALFVGAACGSDRMEAVGDAMVDAGHVLRDASRAMMDAGADAMIDGGSAVRDAGDAMTGDAAAQASDATVIEMECDEKSTRTIEYNDGRVEKRIRWYAVRTIPNLDRKHIVSASKCGYQDLGGSDDYCPSDATCTGNHRPDYLDCFSNIIVHVEGNRVRVGCGHKNSYTGDDGTQTVSGSRWHTARVVVR